ncbi:MAG: glycosyltransferase family 4 protein [Chloroflexales bacterium]
MRLCLISLDFAPVRTSGLAVYAERLAGLLATYGHELTVVAAQRPGTPPRSVVAGIPVERVAVGRSDWIAYSLRAARHVARQHQIQPFDIVHFLDVHFAWAYRGPFVASLFQSFRQRLTADHGQPYGSSWHNRAFRRSYYTGAMHLLERPTLRRARALAAASVATRDEFITHYGVDPARITLTPATVDTAHFAPQPAEAVTALRRQLGLEGCRILLYVGFSTPRKGLEYLAAGLAALPADVRLVIVGLWEPGYRAKVMAAAGAAWGRVHEVGSVTDAALPCYFALADLFVLPSLLEGFGLPALEAMACGTPVVATTAGSLAEVVGPCGALVPPHDTPALVTAINDLLDDKPRRARLSLSARERVLTHFAPQREYAAVLGVYARSRHSAQG